MKSNNLSISLPNKGCDKNCPYCVSKMTGYVSYNREAFWGNIKKVHKMADIAGAINILITSKGEPLLNQPELELVCSEFKEFPVEIQTNGLLLIKDKEMIRKLAIMGVNVVAISIDKPTDFSNFKEVIRNINIEGMIVRLTIALTQDWDGWKFEDVMEKAQILKARQVTFRKLTIPENIVLNDEAKETASWIENHALSHMDVEQISLADLRNVSRVATLPFGVSVYNYHGIGVTLMDYCVQENHSGEDIRSLIYLEDGHLYTSWDKPGSILF